MRLTQIIVISLFLLIPTTVFAQTCKNLERNTLWLNGLSDMKIALDRHDYEGALNSGRDIYGICPDSPAYLLYLTYAFEGKGDLAKAREYIYKASENTSKYETQKHIIQQIWYKRYELDNPERTKESVDELNKQIDSLKAEIAVLKQDSDELGIATAQTESLNQKLDEKNNHHKNDLMLGVWTGAGIGSSGIILLATGIGLVASELDNPVTQKLDQQPQTVRIHDKYIAGWTLVGVGSALTVAGAIVAGIYGYQYTHFTTDTTLSFQILPTSASLSLTF